MSMHSRTQIDAILTSLLDAYDYRYGLGAMTCSVYDSAWVANLVKSVSGIPQYLFPSAFLFVLDSQLPDGSWNVCCCADHTNQSVSAASDASTNMSDSILSTMAALYMLSLHARSPHQIRPARLPAPTLEIRLTRAIASLENLLTVWRIDTCNAVGFEVLIPAMLDLLAGQGYHFEFPDRDPLFKIRAAKIRRISPEMLYKMAPSTLLHSLEAFHGWTDQEFDVRNVKHHLVRGSMMASPAATVSYLMKIPTWDDDAEAYLRLVIECGDGKGNGGVPSAWPSTNFEIIWVISTLLEAGLWTQDDGNLQRGLVLKIISQAREMAGGLVGFTPGIEPDLDDSAKASIILSLLGQGGFSKRILENFESSVCLKTYQAERDPSVSANCNALLCIILDTDDYSSKTAVVEKITHFICDSWINANGSIKDKWNLSPYYPAMLISRALSELLHSWDTGKLPQVSGSLLAEKVMLVLLKCLAHVLHSQRADGSWGTIGPREETAYAILALTSLLSLPLRQSFENEITGALQRGRECVLRLEGRAPEHLWVEKVTYGSKYLAEAYATAAMFASVEKAGSHKVKTFVGVKSCKEAKFGLHLDQEGMEDVVALRNDSENIALGFASNTTITIAVESK